MSRLLDILYVALLIIGSPWLLYRAIFRQRNRRGWLQKLLGLVPRRNTDRPCVWMHAVSVGEVNLLAPVIKRLQQRRPELEIVISTTTETGYDLARQKYATHTIFFCPLDFSWAIYRTLERINPELIVLAELELWPNLISIADAKDIPVTVINGRLSENSFSGYQRLAWLLRPVFAKLTHVAAANQQYANRFQQLGVPANCVSVTGNVKFDGVSTDRENSATHTVTELAGFQKQDFVWVAGSTQPSESLLVAQAYLDLVTEFPQLRLVIVPRHPETSAASAAAIEQLGLPTILRSRLETSRSPQAKTEVLIVDVIGELSAWWGRSDAAYVGGSMGSRGGQNMIEPAGFGVPVSFGPNTRNFRTIVQQLLSQDAAVVVHDVDTLKLFVRQAMGDPKWAHEIGRRAQQLVVQNAGASHRTVDQLVGLLGESARLRDAA